MTGSDRRGVAALLGVARRHLTRPRVQAAIELVGGLCLLGFGGFVVIDAANDVGVVG